MAAHECSGCGFPCDCGGYEDCDLCLDCLNSDREPGGFGWEDDELDSDYLFEDEDIDWE